MLETNTLHPSGSYDGDTVFVPEGSATELWFAEILDGLLVYERERYGVQHPICVSSWPTLAGPRGLTKSGGIASHFRALLKSVDSQR